MHLYFNSFTAPTEIIVFLNGPFHDQIRNADVRKVATNLVAGRVIESNKLESIGPKVDQQSANTSLFEMLLNDPSERKLRVLSCSLKLNPTHDNNQELACMIDQFLGMCASLSLPIFTLNIYVDPSNKYTKTSLIIS